MQPAFTQGPAARFCPACRVPLVAERFGAVVIDRCARCNGAFFDAGELGATFAGADPEVWGRSPGVQPPSPASPYCPAGHGPMWWLPVPLQDGPAAVAACGHCRGVWIDAQTAWRLRAQPPASATADPALSPGAAVGLYLFQLVSTLPVEVSNPVRQRPWVTWGLAASMLFVFFALRVIPPATRVSLESMFMLSPHEIRAGYGLLTPLTYAWIHLNVLHILGNLYFFMIFGDNVEDRFGRARYAGVLALAAVFGALVEVMARGHQVTGVGGASGAVAGVMGAYMVLFPTTKLRVVLAFIPLKLPAVAYLLFWLVLQVVGYLGHKPGVAWLAHVGGFVMGAGAAAVLRLSSPAVEHAR